MKLHGKSTILSLVTEADAADIIELRNNPSINRFLSSSKPIAVEDQVVWLRKNPSGKESFYFMVRNNLGEPAGTISVYNIRNGAAEFGRYVCTKPLQAVESERMLLRFVFDDLKLNYLYCRTAESNESVWRQHLRFGFRDCGNETDEHLGFDLHVQGITREAYLAYDYSKIDTLIQRLS